MQCCQVSIDHKYDAITQKGNIIHFQFLQANVNAAGMTAE